MSPSQHESSWTGLSLVSGNGRFGIGRHASKAFGTHIAMSGHDERMQCQMKVKYDDKMQCPMKVKYARMMRAAPENDGMGNTIETTPTKSCSVMCVSIHCIFQRVEWIDC